MIVPHWLLADIEHTLTATGYKHVVKTNTPCHLWLRWTTTPPRIHSKTILIRGLRLKNDVRFCFVVYSDNEQEEAGDTLIHTFIKEPWPGCETRYFYFHGTVGGQFSPSTTAIFTLHRVAPPYGPPETHQYHPDPHTEQYSVDGWVRLTIANTTWGHLHDDPGDTGVDNATSGYVNLQSGSIPGLWTRLTRLICLFPTFSIPPGALLVSARLKAWAHSKYNDFSIIPAINVFTSSPASNTAIVPADYQSLGSIPLSTEIPFTNFLLGSYNIFPFNQDGLNAIAKGGITKLGLRESRYDAPNIAPTWENLKFLEFVIGQAEGSSAFWTTLEVTYRPPG